MPSMIAVATILVVDDEPRIVQLVRDYLEHGGFTVLVASDGQAALRSARTGRPEPGRNENGEIQSPSSSSVRVRASLSSRMGMPSRTG